MCPPATAGHNQSPLPPAGFPECWPKRCSLQPSDDGDHGDRPASWSGCLFWPAEPVPGVPQTLRDNCFHARPQTPSSLPPCRGYRRPYAVTAASKYCSAHEGRGERGCFRARRYRSWPPGNQGERDRLCSHHIQPGIVTSPATGGSRPSRRETNHQSQMLIAISSIQIHLLGNSLRGGLTAPNRKAL